MSADRLTLRECSEASRQLALKIARKDVRNARAAVTLLRDRQDEMRKSDPREIVCFNFAHVDDELARANIELLALEFVTVDDHGSWWPHPIPDWIDKLQIIEDSLAGRSHQVALYNSAQQIVDCAAARVFDNTAAAATDLTEESIEALLREIRRVAPIAPDANAAAEIAMASAIADHDFRFEPTDPYFERCSRCRATREAVLDNLVDSCVRVRAADDADAIMANIARIRREEGR